MPSPEESQAPSLAGTIFAARPLVPLGLCIVMLDLNEDKILALIEKGELEWAFDIRTGGRRRQVRVFGGCLLGRLTPAAATGWTESRVLDACLPKGRVRASDIARAWTCSPSHLSALIRAGFFGQVETTGKVSGSDSSPWVDREAALRFLSSRRCL